MTRQVVSVTEAGQALGICRNSAYRLARQGVIPSLRLGRKLVVPLRALEAMLADPARFSAAGEPRRQGEAEG